MASLNDLDDALVRFSNAHHVLRELVHLSLGWLALEPRFEVKALLADHAYDDARAVSRIATLVAELRTPEVAPGAPGSELAELLDRVGAVDEPGAYLDQAYGVVKPALIAALKEQLEATDPVLEEPSVRLLAKLVYRQERHVLEMGVERADDDGATAPPDLTVPIQPRHVRPLPVMPPLDVPVRDAFVIVDGDAESDDGMRLPTEPDERGAFLHNLLNNELCAAELSARNSHEHPDMPWSFHVDMARQCWDQMRHAQVLDRALHEEGLLSWGGRPVSFADFTDVYPLDLLGRLALFDGTSGQVAIGDPGQEPLAAVFHRMRTDEVVHAERARRWGAHLLGGDGAAFQQRARELRRMRGTSPTQPVTTS